MKLDKACLIATIDEIEVRIKGEQAAHDAAATEFAKRELATWKADELPKWRALRDLITAKLKTKDTISQEEVNKVLGSDNWGSTRLPYWRDRHNQGRNTNFVLDGKKYDGYPIMDKRLAQLRKALELITDEEVPTSALASMGFRNLEWFFNRVARDQAGL